jgi:hypothetical protein
VVIYIKKTILLIALILATLPLVVAQQSYEDLLKECQFVVKNYDLTGKKIPRVIPYKNEIFNAYTFDNKPLGHLEIKDRTIVSYGCNIVKEPTYRIFIKDYKTIMDIKDSSKPIREFNRKLKDKSISIKGMKFSKKIKWAFTRPLIRLGSLFGR